MTGFACPTCGRQLKVKPELAGKRARCPGCQQAVEVPSTLDTSAALADAATVLPSRGPKPSADEVAPLPLPREGKPEEELLRLLSPAQEPDEIGRLGNYRVLRVLGAGGMGAVLQAEDPLLKRQVALKVMLPALAAFASHRQRFLQEGQAAAAITHDHVVAIFQVGEANGVPFLAMPLLKGESLEAAMKRRRLSIADMLRVGRETAEGLAAAHKSGLIHRDIKPANIWLETVPARPGAESPPFRVKILDFGLARGAGGGKGLTQSGAILGTPGYMAPEQAGGRPVDGRSDLFSLGCVLYRMVTGRAAFRGDDLLAVLMAIATETPPPPAELKPDLPPGLSELIMRLLEKAPADRPQTAGAVSAALGALERQGPAAPAPRAEPAEPKAPSQVAVKERSTSASRHAPGGRRSRKGAPSARSWVLVAGGCIGLATAVAGVLVLLRPTGDSRVARADGARAARPAEKEDPNRPVLAVEAKKALVKPPDPVVPPKPVAPQKVDLVKDWGEEVTNSIGMRLVRIPEGTVIMGSPVAEEGRRPDGEELREVTIATTFYLGVYPVTQAEYETVIGTNPSMFSAGGAGKDKVKGLDTRRFPVEMVSWEEAVKFCDALSARADEKAAGRQYRLPAEAEWEYACRAGTKTRFHSGDAEEALKSVGWYRDNSGGRTHAVGGKKTNRFGLYDMHGNVYQWCSDLYVKGRTEKSDDRRVLRGGSWNITASACRSAFRLRFAPTGRNSITGFRVVCVAAGPR
jgi:formylglycine-generating enzyme required for sulfatase activity/serine/threonine protein kinase